MPDLSVKIKNVTLKNPIIIGSGTPTYGPTNVKKCIRSEAGAFVTKTLCYTDWLREQPRPRFHVEYPQAIDENGYFSLYSTERLNPTPPDEYARKKMKEYSKEARDFGVRVIASIAGTDPETWARLTDLVTENGADLIELNLQCPHVEKGQPTGMVAGRDPELCYSILELVRRMTPLPLIGKVVGEGVDPIRVAAPHDRRGGRCRGPHREVPGALPEHRNGKARSLGRHGRIRRFLAGPDRPQVARPRIRGEAPGPRHRGRRDRLL